ncbi:unnamed protein product, partial [Tetraodon nigroviridis]
MPPTGNCYGLNKAIENISRLSDELLADTCQHILNYLQGQSKGVDSADISDNFQKAGVQFDHDAVESLVRFLLLTFRSAGKSKLSADELLSRLEESNRKWPKASLQVLHRLWSERGALVCAQQEVQAMLSTNQIVDIQWKLGMALTSDTCRSLNSPYVTLLLKFVETSGQICQRSFEMTIPQFQ